MEAGLSRVFEVAGVDVPVVVVQAERLTHRAVGQRHPRRRHHSQVKRRAPVDALSPLTEPMPIGTQLRGPLFGLGDRSFIVAMRLTY